MGAKRRKKRIIIFLIIGAVAALIVFSVFRIRRAQRELAIASANQSITTAAVTQRSIRTKVIGNGTLTEGDVEDLKMPKGIKVRELLVENGDKVAEGQVLARVDHNSVRDAIADVQSQIDKIDEELLEIEDERQDEEVKAPVSGSVEGIYAENGSDAASVMDRNGAILVLLSDGDQREVKITALSGEVREIYVRTGDHVDQGDSLFTLRAVQDEVNRGRLLTQRQDLNEIMNTLYELSRTNEILSDCTGIVRAIYVKEGEALTGSESLSANDNTALAGGDVAALYSSMQGGSRAMSTKRAKMSLMSHLLLLTPDLDAVEDNSAAYDEGGIPTSPDAFSENADPAAYGDLPYDAEADGLDNADDTVDGNAASYNADEGSENSNAYGFDANGNDTGGDDSGFLADSSAFGPETDDVEEGVEIPNDADLSALLAEYLKSQDLSALLAESLKDIDLSALVAENLRNQDLSALIAENLKNQDLSALIAESLKNQDLSALTAESLKNLDLSTLLGDSLKNVDVSALLSSTLKEIDLGSLLNESLKNLDLGTLLNESLKNLDLGTVLTEALKGIDVSALLTETLKNIDVSTLLTETLGETDASTLLSDSLKGIDLGTLLGDSLKGMDLGTLLGDSLKGMDLGTLLGDSLKGMDLGTLLGSSLSGLDTASLLGDGLDLSSLTEDIDLASLYGLNDKGALEGLAGSLDLSSLGTDALTGGTSSPGSRYSDAAAFSIAGADKMDVTIAINELDILSVAKGQTAEVTMDAIEGETFSGIVTEISKTGTNSGGVTKYQVTVEVDRDERMRPDMSCTVSILVSEARDVDVVPTAAVFTEQGRNYVYTSKEEDGTLSGKTEIETGIADGEYVEVRSGLLEGQTVYYRNKTVNYFDVMMGNRDD